MPQRKYGKRSSFRRRPARRGAGASSAKPYRKKRYAKYRLAGSGGITRGFSTAPFPQRLFKTFTFSGAAQKLQQVVTDVPIQYQFRGNSLYDPDYTGIGSQPRYVDTFLGANDTSAPYGRYTVLASKAIVSIWQDPTLTGTSGSTNGVVSLAPMVGSGGSPPNSLKEIQERPFIKWKSIGNANSHAPVVLKMFCKTKALFTGANVLYDQAFGAPYNNNPNQEWVWTVSAVNIISGAGINLFSCFITFRIKYYCMFSTLNDVANS